VLILARVTLLFWPEIIQFSLSRDYYYVCLFGQKLKIRGGEDVEQIINLERPNKENWFNYVVIIVFGNLHCPPKILSW